VDDYAEGYVLVRPESITPPQHLIQLSTQWSGRLQIFVNILVVNLLLNLFRIQILPQRRTTRVGLIHFSDTFGIMVY